MPKIRPCLMFNGQAEEAAKFYVSLLPDSRIDNVWRSPTDTPSGPEGSVLTVEFTLAGTQYLALNMGSENPFEQSISFQTFCENQAEVDRLWAALTDGGEEVACGWLKDRWGLSWQIVPNRLEELIKDPDPARAKRAMQAMMTMVKIDIAALERAVD